MTQLGTFLRSSIGTKMVMAVTGLGLVGFVIAHMLGNLLVFFGPSAINEYADSLRNLPGGTLWVARLGLVAIVVIHIVSAIRLTMMNRAARPVRYKRKQNLVTSYAARTMFWSGLIIAFFIAYHLAHFTFLLTNPEFSQMMDGNRHDVYTMVVTGFQNKAVVALYLVAVALLASHLGHGLPSFFQTLGIRHHTYTPLLKGAGKALAVILFVGFASVPISIATGWITLGGV